MEHLPYAGGVTVHLCVSLTELPLQTVMGQVPAFEYMLSSPEAVVLGMLIWRMEAPELDGRMPRPLLGWGK
jgi:hypothetical protein